MGDLIAHYKFDAGSGTVLVDNSGNSNNGTIYGAPAWVTGKSGYAIDFDGVDDYVSIPDAASLNFGTGDFTICTWFKTSQSADVRNLFYKGAGDGLSGWRFGLDNINYGRPTVLIGDTVGHVTLVFGTTAYNDGLWHHMVVVFDRDVAAECFMDGASIGTGDITSISGSVDNTDAILIGNSYDKYIGSLDETRIYNRALSAAEISDLYHNIGRIETYEPIITATISLTTPIRYASRDYYDNSDNYYRGSIINFPELKENLPDLFYGAEYNQSVSLKIANDNNGIDDNWYTITNNNELRGVWATLNLIEDGDVRTVYTGKISKYSISPEKITLTVDMRHDVILETLLPSKVITATDFDSSAMDVGKPINICFGKCRMVPLWNIRHDTTNEIYDYLIGYGPIEKLGIYPGESYAIIRGNSYVEPNSYTFYNGSQASPYPGYAFVRFTVEQKDYSLNRMALFADLYGLKLGGIIADRNFANCIKAVLSDNTFGLGDSCDSANFATAASNLPIANYMCDGAIIEQRKARDIINDMLLPARNSYISRGSGGSWNMYVPGTGSSVATFGDNDGYWNNCKVVEVTSPSAKNSISRIHANYGFDGMGTARLTGDYNTGASFGIYKSYDLKFVNTTETIMKFFSYLAKITTYDRRITLYCGLEAKTLDRGNIITVKASNKPPLETGKDWIIESIVKLPSFSDKSEAKYEIVGREYDSSLYDDLTGGSTTEYTPGGITVNGPKSVVGSVTLGDGKNLPGTLTLTGSSGDIYINAGKTDFDNLENGFILGLDYSDSDKAKFFLGNSTKYLNWDGINWVLKAGNFEFDADGNITATNAKLYGSVTATSGEMGGWTIAASKLSAGQVDIDAANKRIRVYSGENYIELSQNGLIGFSSTLGEVLNIPIDGSAPTFSSGVIKDAIHQLYTTGVIQTAASGRRILINSNGIQLLTGATTGKWGSFKWGDGTKYGSGAIMKLHNRTNEVPLEFLTEQNVGDIHFVDRFSDPTGEAKIGDVVCVNGQLKLATVAGTPGTWEAVGGTDEVDPDLLMLGGM